MCSSSSGRMIHLLAVVLIAASTPRLLTPTLGFRVLVVGGTHGNEYTGVWCMRHLERRLQQDQNRFPGLEIETLLANPTAHRANRRFLETDLNREFTTEKLAKDGGDDAPPLEARRAQELHHLYGPKDNPTMDCCIDLHTTTSNMGTCLIVRPGDALMVQAAAYVAKSWTRAADSPPVRLLLLPDKPRLEHAHLGSALAHHDIMIEVGPVPQGVLRHDIVQDTQLALELVLEFLQKRNSNNPQLVVDDDDATLDCYMSAPPRPGQLAGKLAWPSLDDDNPNFPGYLVHESIQDRDFEVQLRKGDPLFVDLDDNIIPYDGSFGDEISIFFVNEGGYYYASSGCGIGVAVKRKISLKTGQLLPVVDETTMTA